jgi:predicted TIM-barrel fold metal-dependent hydrolase
MFMPSIRLGFHICRNALSRHLPPRLTTCASCCANSDRVVIVQPLFYGTNNSYVLDAVRQLGPSARALAIIDKATPRSALEELAAGGFRGVRLNFETSGVADPDVIKDRIDAVAEQTRGLNWYLHFYSQPSVIAQLKDHLAHRQSLSGAVQRRQLRRWESAG